MGRLKPILIPAWPKLAWVAEVLPGDEAVTVRHGPLVEVGEDWLVEAVWAGEFAAGDFDRTSLVFGSGVRCREGGVTFVSPASGADRLWYCQHEGRWVVSNSLPAMLTVAGLSLREDCTNYTADIESVERRGLANYVRALPTSGADACMLYFANLVWDGSTIAESPKPIDAPHFGCFADYEHYLLDTAERIKVNATDPRRHQPVAGLVGISSGYDSPAVAVIARHAGCRQAVTIKQSRSVWRGSDSGEAIAAALGMDCRAYDRCPSGYRDEVALWAATGLAGGLNFTLFDYPQPLCLLFSGSYGDKVWDRFPHDLSNPVGDRDHLLGEFRLFQGVFQCLVPWWGIARANEINALGAREEMQPWALGTGYDRPVARRLVEEAGVPRKAFGMLKKDTSSNVEFLWPFSPQARESFRRYCRARGLRAPGPGAVAVIRRLAHAEKLLHANLFRKLGIRRRLRPWRRLAGPRLLFQWANEELCRRYRDGLEPSRVAGSSGGARPLRTPGTQHAEAR